MSLGEIYFGRKVVGAYEKGNCCPATGGYLSDHHDWIFLKQAQSASLWECGKCLQLVVNKGGDMGVFFLEKEESEPKKVLSLVDGVWTLIQKGA